MKNFWLVFRKELTCCGRDPDVFIYAFLLPLVLYPLSAVLVNEASLWYASMQEKNRDTVYVKGVSPLSFAISQGLRSKKHFNVIDDDTATADPHTVLAIAEQKKNATAIVAIEPATNEVTIEAHETSSHLGTVADQIETEIREARFKALKEKLAAKGISTDILNVFTVDREGVKKTRTLSTTNGDMKQIFDKLLALLVTFMILMMTVIGGPASVCMMAEEHEKKTFLTTLLLPIDRMVVIISKFLTVTVICITGAAFNMVCLAVFVVFLLASVLGQSFSLAKMVTDFQHLTIPTGAYYLTTIGIVVSRIRQFVQVPDLPEVLMMVAFFCSTGALLSAIYLCVASYGKTVKSAQMLVSLPMIFLMALPTIAMIPGIQFNARTAFIPIANLLIMRKFDNPPMLLATIAMLEPLIIVVLILFWVRKNFESQIEGKNQGKNQGRKKSKGDTVEAA